MHFVRLSARLKNKRWDLTAGTYLAEDLSIFEIAAEVERGAATVREFEGGISTAGDATLLICNGGFGDMLLLVPALRAFYLAHPGKSITLCCRRRTWCMFENLPYCPILIDYPIPAELLHCFRDILTTEHSQEAGERARTVPAIDIKAAILGVGPLVGAARKPEYIVTMAERMWAESNYPKRGRGKRIGIQLAASSPTRTYHPKRAGEVMRQLYELGHELYIFGTPGSLPVESVPESIRGSVRNLTADKLEFRQSAAVMTTCDCMWVPDSSLMHVAGALDIPTVAIFASTHWKMRTSDYSSVLAIQSNMGCSAAPCFVHPKGSSIWPAGEICEQQGHCVPMSSISPETIVAKIQKQIASREQAAPR